jgi:GH15 family glucan-1,4-alpha-glucosidase
MQTLDLAVIGKSVVSALIDRMGRHVWHCHPRLDADPIFCALLDDENGGFMDVELEGFASSSQAYVGNTAILETKLTDAKGGKLRIIDFAPRFKQYGRMFRPAMIVRRIEPEIGRCRIRVRVKPRFNYGADPAQTTRGSNHIRFWAGDTVVRLTTDGPISYIAEEHWFVLDHPIDLILAPDETIAGSVTEVVRRFLERTDEYWKDWVRYLSIPFEWQEAVIRAAVTLKLCSFEESGGIVAAMTTSIPEGPEHGRGWDYRFCWVRDAYFVVEALNRLGATLTMEDFIRYVTDVAAIDPDGELKPVYAIRAIADSGPCGSATQRRCRRRTTATATSSWRRHRCSSTGGCPNAATSTCSHSWSGWANERSRLRLNRTLVFGNFAAGRASTPIRP